MPHGSGSHEQPGKDERKTERKKEQAANARSALHQDCRDESLARGKWECRGGFAHSAVILAELRGVWFRVEVKGSGFKVLVRGSGFTAKAQRSA